MAGKNSIAQKVSSMAGKISIGKGMQVSKAGMTSMAKQVQSELNRAKLNLKLNKIDADAPITEVGKQLKEEVSDICLILKVQKSSYPLWMERLQR